MAKQVLTLAILSLAVTDIAAAIKSNPDQAAQDIKDIMAESETNNVKSLAGKDAEIEAKNALVKELQIEVSKLSKEPAKPQALTFELEGKKYGFNFNQLKHKGNLIIVLLL